MCAYRTSLTRAHAFRREEMRRLLTVLTPEERATLLTLLEQAISGAEEETNQ